MKPEMTLKPSYKDGLDPRLCPLADQFLTLVNKAIFPSICKITVTYRNAHDQDLAKSKGLSNAASGQSPHNCCDATGRPAARAFDFAIFAPDGKYVTDGTDVRYAKAGGIAIGINLDWGGSWAHPDYDHVQLKDWKIY